MEGFFTVVAGDGASQEITVITDVVGSCHCFVRQLGESVVISSSSMLLASLGPEVTPDPISCQEFLGMGVVYEDRTLYREVTKLPAATVTRFCRGRQAGQSEYWSASSVVPESLSLEAASDALWAAMVESSRKIGSRFSNVVCDVTGGYDSRAVAASFLGAGIPFSAVVSGPAESADVRISRELSRKLGIKHSYYPRTAKIADRQVKDALSLCDGEYDVVEYSSIAQIHSSLAERFDISINGSFGEVARGYWWELLVPHTGAEIKLDSHELAQRRYAWKSSADLFQPEHRIELADHMASVVDRAVAGLEAKPNTFQMDVSYLRMRMQHWQGRIASSTNRIWPCLSPFMFRSVLEVMLQAPPAIRQRSLLVRKMLAQKQPALANYPLENGYPAVPATWKNFLRFSPLAIHYGKKALRKAWPARTNQGMPSPSAAVRAGLWQEEEIEALLKPQSMRAVSVLDPAALTTFLDASRKLDFSRDQEWQRLLSLEMAFTSAFSTRQNRAFAT
jgi:hypothetical protein